MFEKEKQTKLFYFEKKKGMHIEVFFFYLFIYIKH